MAHPTSSPAAAGEPRLTAPEPAIVTARDASARALRGGAGELDTRRVATPPLPEAPEVTTGPARDPRAGAPPRGGELDAWQAPTRPLLVAPEVTTGPTHDANVTALQRGVGDLNGRQAPTRPLLMESELTIRAAGDADALAIQRLSELDCQRVPAGPLLIAFVAGEPWAAVQVSGDATIADPFRPTAEVVEILRARAAQLRGRPRRLLRSDRFASPPLARIARGLRRPPGHQALGR